MKKIKLLALLALSAFEPSAQAASTVNLIGPMWDGSTQTEKIASVNSSTGAVKIIGQLSDLMFFERGTANTAADGSFVLKGSNAQNADYVYDYQASTHIVSRYSLAHIQSNNPWIRGHSVFYDPNTINSYFMAVSIGNSLLRIVRVEPVGQFIEIMEIVLEIPYTSTSSNNWVIHNGKLIFNYNDETYRSVVASLDLKSHELTLISNWTASNPIAFANCGTQVLAVIAGGIIGSVDVITGFQPIMTVPGSYDTNNLSCAGGFAYLEAGSQGSNVVYILDLINKQVKNQGTLTKQSFVQAVVPVTQIAPFQ